MYTAYVIDTDTVSFAIRGEHPGLRRKWNRTDSDRIFISAVTAAELLAGIRKYGATHHLVGEVRGFLRSAHVIDWDLAAAEAYADIRQSLSMTHQLIGELDMMIAAHALSRDFTLVSNNTRHFQRLVPPLQLENWTEA